jgi:isopenicillin N synthase-like dioxygenase
MQNNYIPNIDISSLVSSDFSDNDYQNVAKQIKKASEEVGFFTVTGHGISNEKIDQILSTCRHFFHSPDEEKIKIAPKKWNANTDTVYRGYFPSSVNGKEGLDIGDPRLTLDMKDLLSKEKFEVNHDIVLFKSKLAINH